MSYRAVLFDMDGVIVNSDPAHAAAFQATLKRHGHNLSQDQYEQYFAGKTDEAGFRQYFDAINEPVQLQDIMKEKAKAYKAYIESAPDQLLPYPGVIAFISELAKQKIPLALVTGSLRAEADITLRTFGIAKYFAVVVAAEDISQSKPNPEGYLHGARALEVDPVDCIVIEDTPSGVKAANTAGMRCVAVTSTHGPEELSDASVVIDQLRPGCLDLVP